MSRQTHMSTPGRERRRRVDCSLFDLQNMAQFFTCVSEEKNFKTKRGRKKTHTKNTTTETHQKKSTPKGHTRNDRLC